MALTYVQDSYQFVRLALLSLAHIISLLIISQILGDALVGVVFVRNGISTGMIFAVPPWMVNMGIYDMFVVCGVLAAVIALTCVPFLIWGRAWRVKLASRYAKYAKHHV
jgi:hypothetical protein